MKMLAASKEDLKNNVLQYQNRLRRILQRLEWSEEEVLKDYNTNSLACTNKEVVKKPVTPKIANYPESWVSNNSVVIDTPKLQEILHNNEVAAPRNFRELQSNFSREQKLQIYEHVIGNTEKLQNNKVDQVADGELSLANILSQKKREEKLKKRKFRKTKPTQIEELKCLVDLQMEALQQFMGNKMKKEENVMIETEKSRDESYHYKAYNERDKYRDRSADISSNYHRKDRFNDYKGNHSKDIWHERRRPSRSCSRERRKYSPSSHKEFAYERSRHSGGRYEDVSRESIRHSGSYKETYSKETRKHSSNHNIETSRERRRSRSYNRELIKERSHNRELIMERRRSRSRSKERTDRRRYNEEMSYRRSRNSGSRSKDNRKARKRSRSRSKDVRKERKHHSNLKKDISKKRRHSRSRSKDI